jgi:hypothetical protein
MYNFTTSGVVVDVEEEVVAAQRLSRAITPRTYGVFNSISFCPASQHLSKIV